MEGDTETPVSMVGRKVVPILQKEDGSYMPESMDIVNYIDQLNGKPQLTGQCDKFVETWCRDNTRTVFSLAIPRFTKADFKELTTGEARQAYIQREIKAFGDLDALIADSHQLTESLLSELTKIEPYLNDKTNVGLTDFYLFPLLNSLTVVKNFPFSRALGRYLEFVSTSCNVQLFTSKAL
jgi:glutaredoxin 2